MEIVRVFLNAKEEKEILQGYPWVFDNEISHIKHRANEKSEWKYEELKESTVEDGSVVEIFTKAGGFLGTGVINKKSKITVRIISSDHEDKLLTNTYAFWEKRITNALDIRKSFYKENDY